MSEELPVDPLETMEPTENAEPNESASAPDETDAGSPTPETPPSEPENSESKASKRIHKITAEKWNLKNENQELKRRLDELESKQQAKQEVEPTLEQYDYDETEYNRALIRHEAKKAARESYELEQKAVTQRQAEDRQAQMRSDYNSRAAQFAADKPDWVDAVSALPTFGDELVNAVMGHDQGPDITYYLAKNLDVADDIASMSPTQAAMKLGEITAQLSMKKPETKTSQAPEPVSTVTPSGASVGDIGDPDMPMADWMKIHG